MGSTASICCGFEQPPPAFPSTLQLKGCWSSCCQWLGVSRTKPCVPPRLLRMHAHNGLSLEPSARLRGTTRAGACSQPGPWALRTGLAFIFSSSLSLRRLLPSAQE